MRPHSLVLLLPILIVTSLSSNTTSVHALTNETDHSALLKFKESISNDPFGVLDSWNSSTHFCNWLGITCGSKHQRVTELDLTGHKLHGPISPQLGNLSFLRYMDLEANNFYGTIPQELGRLSRLETLYINNNSLIGTIPANLTGCTRLTLTDFSWNNFIGGIPVEFGTFKNLKELYIQSNNLTGQIPPSIGNISSLTDLALAENNLEGNLPQELGRLKNLTYVSVSANKLSGKLPSFLYSNVSYIRNFFITVNQFSGSLPPNLFNTLPNLQRFVIGANSFSGTIPASITNASLLQLLDFGGNLFVGHVPSLVRLKELRSLILAENNLGGNSTEDLEFLKTLTNSTNLNVLDIYGNNFGSQLPNFLGNLSSQLSQLYLGSNQIYGKIPVELANLVSLNSLGMDNNHFSGTIPNTFGKLKNLKLLDLSGNNLSGNISAFIGNLSKLFSLDLSKNLLEGNIPTSIKNCQNLQYLNLFKNNLRGAIPQEVFSLTSLTTKLDLSHNFFSGNLPDEVGNLINLNMLNLSDNNLSGNIPGTIGECLSLVYLYLQGNSFHGVIPSSLTSLRGLQELDLSRNRLSGSIPQGLQDFMFLELLNVSFNMLEGEVPTKGVFRNASKLAVTGNNELCGGVSQLHLPPCPGSDAKLAKHHHFRFIAVIVSVVASILILSSTLTIFWIRKRNMQPSSDLPTIGQMGNVSYQNLYHGTDGFSVRNLLGSGNFGSVYKGTLESEDNVVAIKVFNLQKKAAEKSFLAECNALRNIRHRNLVKVLTCCSSTDYKGQGFKAIVFEFMANGSLESWLHPSTETVDQPRSLTLEQRLNIINDVASAFHYLQYECEQTIIHCDLKPSNILLDDCMVAHVGDFGLARILTSFGVSLTQTSTLGIKGTIGYAPPEYGMGSELSIEGDMYSFGILILEMLIGKRPTDEMFKDGYNIREYVKTSIPNQLFHIVDESMLPEELEQGGRNDIQDIEHHDVEKCLLSLVRIALACSEESPKQRMSMSNAMIELNLIKSFFPSR